MEEKDLRLGNYIYDYEGNVGRVVSIQSTSIKIDDEKSLGFSCLTLKPIPLTEEWLIKFGFVKVRDYPVLRLGGLQIEFNGFDSQWESGLLDGKTVVKYVHEIQNLFFALKGEELMII